MSYKVVFGNFSLRLGRKQWDFEILKGLIVEDVEGFFSPNFERTPAPEFKILIERGFINGKPVRNAFVKHSSRGKLTIVE